MGEIILGILANILRAYAIYRFMELLHTSIDVKSPIKFIVYGIFVCLTSGGYYIFHNLFLNIFTNVLGLLIISMLYQGSWMKKIMLIACIYSVNVVVECLVFSITGLYVQYDEMTLSIKECIISMGILFFATVLERIQIAKKTKFEFSYPVWLALFCIPLISIMEIVCMWNKSNSSMVNAQVETGGILLINIALFYLFDSLQDYYKQKSEREEFYTAMKYYSNQLDLMKESWQKMRSLRHDLKHHFCELHYLAEQNDVEKINSYLTEMESYMTNPDEQVSSGNKEIDGILNYLLQNARQSLDDVKLHVSVPEEMEIHSFALNVILGNLLDNAICAAKASKQKYLNVNIRVRQGVLYIKIENSYDGTIRTEGRRLLTIKADKESHGIGLENVRRIVDESDGEIEVKWNETVFCVNVMLFLEKVYFRHL